MTDNIVSLATARAAMRRAAGTAVSPPHTIFDPDPAEEAPFPAFDHLATDRLLTYAGMRDELMFRGLGPALFNQDHVPAFERLEGVRILRGHPMFRFMEAVRDDDLDRVFELAHRLAGHVRAGINVPHFFYFAGSGDVCFVTPAHLARSTTMAHALKTELNARFDVPDSEGKLPQSYWARHARDPYLFIYGEKHLHMNMGESGGVAGIRYETHETPIWEAVDAQNPAATGGLGRCASANINTPRRRDFCGFTPLMIQAVQASTTLDNPQSAAPLRTIKTTWHLAASPHIDWARRDRDNQTVMDLPLHTTVSRLLRRVRSHGI